VSMQDLHKVYGVAYARKMCEIACELTLILSFLLNQGRY